MVKFTCSLILLLGYITYGWALAWWWVWFIVPYGVRPITLGEAVLIRATIFLFATRVAPYVERPDYTANQALANAFFFSLGLPCTLWLVGYIVKTYFWGA